MSQKSLGLTKKKAPMIKINVIEHNSEWFDYIKNPKKYINRKISKLNSKNKNFIENSIFCTLLLSEIKKLKNLRKFRNKNKVKMFYHSRFIQRLHCKVYLKMKRNYFRDIIINLKKIKKILR